MIKRNESHQDPLELPSLEADSMEDLAPSSAQFEEGGQATLEGLLEVNPDTEDESCSTFISKHMYTIEKKVYINFKKKIRDVFAWKYRNAWPP